MTQKSSGVNAVSKIVKRDGPVMVERHDFTASLYSNGGSKEPFFHISAKGCGSIDIFKVAIYSLTAVAALSALKIMGKVQQLRKNKIKKHKEELKAERKAFKTLKKELK